MPDPTQQSNDVFQQALKQYPIVQGLGLSFQHTPRQGDNQLEFWTPGEPGTADQPRPQSIPLDKPGVEVYSDKVQPDDILGDVITHYLRNSDPVVKGAYDSFVSSMTADQKSILQQQYNYSKENEGETRPFEQWAQADGIPAWVRGYAVNQWPKEFTDKVLKPEQKQLLDNMMTYVKGGQQFPASVYQKQQENQKMVKTLRSPDGGP